MKTHKLKLFEILNLESEISGLSNPSTNEYIIEGLLHQKLPAVIKYWLNSTLETLKIEKKILNNLRNDLIKKYGDKDDFGKISINPSIKTNDIDKQNNPIFIVNPKYIEFINEYNSVLMESKEIKLPIISLDELSQINTSDNYPLVFKYIIENPNNIL